MHMMGYPEYGINHGWCPLNARSFALTALLQNHLSILSRHFYDCVQIRVFFLCRKNLKKAFEEHGFSLHEGQSIMQVVSLRGSNLIEVRDAKGETFLALFPAKFQRSFWIKKGSFVVVDDGGKEKALESGNKIACIVSQVLFHGQLRALEKSPDWPAIFKNTRAEEPKASPLQPESDHGDEPKSDSEDDLPPLEANLNRSRPFELYSDSESEEDT